MRVYLIKNETEKLIEPKRTCIHCEPNYGVLWFYFKIKGSDNSLDIWNNAEDKLR